MKHILPLLSLLLVTFTFNGCIFKKCSGEKEPTITYVTTVEEYYRYSNTGYYGGGVSFRGNPGDKYVEFDANRVCPTNHNSPFRTLKPYRNAPINSGDKCEACKLSWSLHKEK